LEYPGQKAHQGQKDRTATAGRVASLDPTASLARPELMGNLAQLARQGHLGHLD